MNFIPRSLLLFALVFAGSSSWLGATSVNSVLFNTYEEPAFPAALAPTRVMDGYATVAFTANPAGSVEDAVIVAASHPAFAESVLAATRAWRLAGGEDALKADNASTARREILRYEFRRHGAIISLTHRDSIQGIFSASLDDARDIRTVNWRDLAAPPARVAGENPRYPKALRAQSIAGSATVNFVIDPGGAVRVPVVIAADRPEFGELALAAIKQWRFSPPLQNGRPVNVEAERRFRFGAGAK